MGTSFLALGLLAGGLLGDLELGGGTTEKCYLNELRNRNLIMKKIEFIW